jgi:hypothetical protein
VPGPPNRSLSDPGWNHGAWMGICDAGPTLEGNPPPRIADRRSTASLMIIGFLAKFASTTAPAAAFARSSCEFGAWFIASRPPG